MKVLILGLCFWAQIIQASYTANLATALINKNSGNNILSSIDDANTNGANICVEPGMYCIIGISIALTFI